MAQTVITNRALYKMKQYRLVESQVLDAFNSGTVEQARFGKMSVKKYHNYEIGVLWIQDERGIYKIISCWKRDRR